MRTIFGGERVGPLPWWVYAGVIAVDVVLLALALTLFYGLVDWLEDFPW